MVPISGWCAWGNRRDCPGCSPLAALADVHFYVDSSGTTECIFNVKVVTHHLFVWRRHCARLILFCLEYEFWNQNLLKPCLAVIQREKVLFIALNSFSLA